MYATPVQTQGYKGVQPVPSSKAYNPMSTSKRYLKELSAIVKVFEIIREYDTTGLMPMQVAQVFLTVAMNQGCTQRFIEENCSISQSAASRNVQLLGGGTLTKPGLGLVQEHQDKDDPRRKAVFLSPKGHAVAERLIGLFAEGGEAGVDLTLVRSNAPRMSSR